MALKQQVYSCGNCDQMVTVVHQGGGRLVCCGKPMMQAGDETTVSNRGLRGSGHDSVTPKPAPANAPYWKCSNCRYVLQASQPPETCPSCSEHCQFTDVTCYIPECGLSGTDNRLIAG
jgi:desulfoferrodoxin-like iron-binding protein